MAQNSPKDSPMKKMIQTKIPQIEEQERVSLLEMLEEKEIEMLELVGSIKSTSGIENIKNSISNVVWICGAIKCLKELNKLPSGLGVATIRRSASKNQERITAVCRSTSKETDSTTGFIEKRTKEKVLMNQAYSEIDRESLNHEGIIFENIVETQKEEIGIDK